MIGTGRIILRITPLLDLLLIVLFAQFMEQESTTRQQLAQRAEQAATALADRQAAEQARAEAVATRQQFARAIEAKNRIIAEQQKLLMAREQRLRQLSQSVDSLARLARQQLKIPPEAVRHALQGATPNEVDRLLGELARASTESVAQIIRYLRTNVEFRNHWDVWEVHVNSDDSLRLRRNDQVVAEELFITSSDNFLKNVRDLFDREEPKSTVLILLSWSDASLKTRLAAKQGIEALAAILENKWARPKKFYISLLGYTPQSP